MFLLLLFSCLVYSSVKTQKSWVDEIVTVPSKYVNQLYCGTAARGITYLSDEDKKPVDSKGFAEGLAKIIAVYESNTPILNKIEAKWLRSQVMAIWKERGIKEAWKNRGDIYKAYKVLLFMKKASNRVISFASLLTDAKDKRALVHANEIAQSLTFLDEAEKGTSDSACLSLIGKLRASLASRQTSSTATASGKGVKSIFKNLQKRYQVYKAIDAAVNKAMESVHKDNKNRSKIKQELKTAAEKAVKSSSSKDSETVKAVIEAAFAKIIPHKVTIESLAESMKDRPENEQAIIADIINGIHLLPESMTNREISFISIYLYSHMKTYLKEKSDEDRLQLIVAAELISKYMKPAYQDSKNEPLEKQTARIYMRAIFRKLDIDEINDFMGFTDFEVKESKALLYDGDNFKNDNDMFWILEIIGVDLTRVTRDHKRTKELIAILDDSNLSGLYPGIPLIVQRLKAGPPRSAIEEDWNNFQDQMNTYVLNRLENETT
jgi:hypothetical protein